MSSISHQVRKNGVWVTCEGCEYCQSHKAYYRKKFLLDVLSFAVCVFISVVCLKSAYLLLERFLYALIASGN